MIDIDKLVLQLSDSNNFNPARIAELLAKHQKTIMAVFFIGTLALIGGMYSDYHIKEGNISAQLSQEQGKFKVIKDRDEAVQNLKNFKSSLPSKSTNELELITQISNDANLCNVTTGSLSPSLKQDMGLYDIINVHFSVVSDNFKEMMLFLRKIERSDPPLRINTWSASEGEDGKISSDIEVSAVHIHL